MRHQKKRATEFRSRQKSSNVMRNLLTSLVDHGQIVTTGRKARALKSRADALFGKLVKMYDKYDNEVEAEREMLRLVKSIIFTDKAGKKLAKEFVPGRVNDGVTTGFVRSLKLGPRPWDNAEKYVVSLS